MTYLFSCILGFTRTLLRRPLQSLRALPKLNSQIRTVYHGFHKPDGFARTPSDLDLSRLDVSIALFLVSDASLLQKVLGRGSILTLWFAIAFFSHLPCQRPTSSPFQHNAIITSRPRPAGNTEDGVYDRGASRPVRLTLSHRASHPAKRNSTAPRLSCHVRAPEAQLSTLSRLLTFADSAPEARNLY